MQTILIALTLVFSLGMTDVASAARLDKNGCYTKKKTGEYVCPHGNKAEKHAMAPEVPKPTAARLDHRVARNDHAVTMNDAGHSNCCKVCKTGKACGDGCIAKNEVCHKEAGCACAN